MTKKRRFTAEKKVEVLRELLENKVSMSDLAERYGIHPNSIHQWKKQMFEGAVAAMDSKRDLNQRQAANLAKHHERKEAALNEVIAELTQENLKLKKKNGAI